MGKRAQAGTPALMVLQRAGVEHTVETYEHDPRSTNFGLEAATALGLEPAMVFKTLLALVDEQPTVAIVPVNGRLDLKVLASARGGKKARMMEASAAERLTGYVVGGISPLGQRTASATVLDSSALDHPVVYVSGGRRGLDIGMAPADLVMLTNAEVARIAPIVR
jgi:Cys-tRNA(Pro)/Cys-tRNA(Cys) deacylase